MPRENIEKVVNQDGRRALLLEARAAPPRSRPHDALGVGALSLALGMAGYAHYERLPWRDAFLTSAMLLGGMGPVAPPATPAGKVVAGLYARYCGLVVLVAVGIVFAPLLHRLLHRLHWIDEGERRR